MHPITVVVCGSIENEQTTAHTLLRALSRYGGVQFYDGEKLLMGNDRPNFYLYQCDGVPEIPDGRGVIIFDSSYRYQEGTEINLSEGMIPVLDDHNREAARALRGTGNIAVTCSTAARATLSIASFDYDKAVVSLQRDLRLLNGEVTEPSDIALSLSEETEAYPLMAACAVLLLAGIEGDYKF